MTVAKRKLRPGGSVLAKRSKIAIKKAAPRRVRSSEAQQSELKKLRPGGTVLWKSKKVLHIFFSSVR
jgi:hypothetical protein